MKGFVWWHVSFLILEFYIFEFNKEIPQSFAIAYKFLLKPLFQSLFIVFLSKERIIIREKKNNNRLDISKVLISFFIFPFVLLQALVLSSPFDVIVILITFLAFPLLSLIFFIFFIAEVSVVVWFPYKVMQTHHY